MPSPCVVEPFNVREDRRPRRLPGSGRGEATRTEETSSALPVRTLGTLGRELHSIWRIEAGRTGAEPRTVRQFAADLGVEPHELLKGEGDGKRRNSEGSICRRKDGRWIGRYTIQAANGPKQNAISALRYESPLIE